MKKSILWLMLLALLLLCGTASAAWPTPVKVDFVLYVGEGETVYPNYPDLTYLIDENLTIDDFDVRYSKSLYTTESVGFNADGSYHESGTGVIPRTTPFYMFYTPKKGVNAKETVFQGTISIHKPLTSVSFSDNDVVMAIDELVTLQVNRSANSAPAIQLGEYDENIVKPELTSGKLTITPLAVGETDIVIRAYNGVTASLHVKVGNPPSKFEFLAEDFICYTGDTIPIQADLGDGAMYGQPTINIIGNYAYYRDFFPNSWREFYADEPGEYTITMTTYNGHTDSFNAVVYSKENCVQMTILPKTITVGDEYVYIYCYDRNGNYISPKLEITQGSDIAKVEKGKLVTTGAGTVTIRAVNPDGTTVEKTVEVHEAPTQIILNATEVTLEIGETFELEIGFDKGTADYTMYWQSWGPDEYGLYPVKVEGQTMTAVTVGRTDIDVRAGLLSAQCVITVVENDKRLLMDRPEVEFAIGHTYQLRVVDKGGNVHPAKFRAQYQSASCPVIVTEDGLMTGQTAGECFVYADLDNGLTMSFKQHVVQIPAWLSHEDVTLKLNEKTPSLGSPMSDMGYVSDYTVEIADESIATIEGGLKLLKEGTTAVTMTAVKGGAQCTFTLTVAPPEDVLYIIMDGERFESDCYTLYLPVDYALNLPSVMDASGKPVTVTWKKVDSYGSRYFEVYTNGKIKATRQRETCELVATDKKGRTFELNLESYVLAEEIYCDPSAVTINVGNYEWFRVEAVTNGLSGRVGDLTWTVGDEEIVKFEKAPNPGSFHVVTGLKPGTTTVTAKQINGATATCTITVVDPHDLPGDADNSGAVTLEDCVLVLQHCAGEAVEINLSNADANGDGRVDIHDALLIMQYVAGWNVTLQ